MLNISIYITVNQQNLLVSFLCEILTIFTKIFKISIKSCFFIALDKKKNFLPSSSLFKILKPNAPKMAHKIKKTLL
jgi:hypothetical protein